MRLQWNLGNAFTTLHYSARQGTAQTEEQVVPATAAAAAAATTADAALLCISCKHTSVL